MDRTRLISSGFRITVAVCVASFFGTVGFYLTSSVLGSIIIAITSAIISYFVADRLLHWRYFSRHWVFFKELDDLLEPSNLCPVVLEDAREKIRDAIAETKTLSEELFTGSHVPWERYSELLESSLGYNNLQFLATCFLSPVQFMDNRFAPYRGVQEKMPSTFLERVLRLHRRFRVMVVDKGLTLDDYADIEKRRTMRQFFDWHHAEDIPIYVITRDEFRKLHQASFKAVELNDFVYFGTGDYRWVVGGLVDYDEEEVILEGMPFVRVIASFSGSIEVYRRFTQRLLKKHAKRIGNLEELIKWCSS